MLGTGWYKWIRGLPKHVFSKQTKRMASVAGYRCSDFAGSTHFKKCPGPAQAGWGWFRCWISPVKSSASANTSIYLEDPVLVTSKLG